MWWDYTNPVTATCGVQVGRTKKNKPLAVWKNLDSKNPLKATQCDTKFIPIHFQWHTSKSLRKALWDSWGHGTNQWCEKRESFLFCIKLYTFNLMKFTCRCILPGKLTTKRSDGSESLVFTCSGGEDLCCSFWDCLFYVPALQDHRYKNKVLLGTVSCKSWDKVQGVYLHNVC